MLNLYNRERQKHIEANLKEVNLPIPFSRPVVKYVNLDTDVSNNLI